MFHALAILLSNAISVLWLFVKVFCFMACPSVLSLYNLKLHKTEAVKNICIEELIPAQSRYFELFWPHTKLPLNGRKPENNSLIR